MLPVWEWGGFLGPTYLKLQKHSSRWLLVIMMIVYQLQVNKILLHPPGNVLPIAFFDINRIQPFYGNLEIWETYNSPLWVSWLGVHFSCKNNLCFRIYKLWGRFHFTHPMRLSLFCWYGAYTKYRGQWLVFLWATFNFNKDLPSTPTQPCLRNT